LEPIATPVIPFRFHWAAAAIFLLMAGTVIWYLNQPSAPTKDLVKESNKSIPTQQLSIPNVVDTIERTITAALTKPAVKAKNLQRGFPAATPITTIHTVSELSNNDLAKINLSV
jgi:hypothetical protein